MALNNEEPAFACSASVQFMRDELGEKLVTAVDLCAYLMDKHPEYAGGRAAAMILAGQADAERRSVDEWLRDVSTLYADEERPLDGRLVILGLALMIGELRRALERDDFFQSLAAEYQPDYDSLLSSAGRELFSPRTQGEIPPAEEAEGIGGPGAPGDFLGDKPGYTGLEESQDIFESFDPFARPGEEQPLETAVGFPEEEVFESMEPAQVAGEPAFVGSEPDEEVFESAARPGSDDLPENEGEKGSEPDTLPQEAAAEEGPLKQARRLEAAMPGSVQVQQTTEVLVMLPRVGSEGLRAFLPKETEAGEIIDKDDVEERGTELVFEAPDKPLTVYYAVEAAQKDFEIEEAVKRVKIHADSDGDYEVFYLTPLRATNRAPVQVRLFKDEALSDVVSTIRLFAKIDPPELGDGVDPQLATLWRAAAYAAVPLNLNVSGDYISVGAISGSEGVAIGGGASAVVSRTNTIMAAGSVTQLFTPLLRAVFGAAPLDQMDPAIENVQTLQVEVEKGPGASDPQIAALLQIIVEMVPAAAKAVLELFGHPEVRVAAGDVTQFVLGRIEQQ